MGTAKRLQKVVAVVGALMLLHLVHGTITFTRRDSGGIRVGADGAGGATKTTTDAPGGARAASLRGPSAASRDSAHGDDADPDGAPVAAGGDAGTDGAAESEEVSSPTRNAADADSSKNEHRASIADKFLVVGNSFGRHNNQMVVLTAGMALANRTGRILVLPDLAFGGGKGGGGSVVVPPSSVYRLTPDQVVDFGSGQQALCVRGSACVVTAAAFAAILGDTTVSVGCLTMRGVENKPRPPRGVPRMQCAGSATQEVSKKKELARILAAMERLKEERVVYAPLVMYVAAALEPVTSMSWRLFSPPTRIARVVRALVALGTNSNATSASFVGVHLRSLEGSCKSRVLQYIRDDMPYYDDDKKTTSTTTKETRRRRQAGARVPAATATDARALLSKQCAMDGKYVSSFMPTTSLAAGGKAGSEAGANSKRLFTRVRDSFLFIADDGQQPELPAAIGASVDAFLVRSSEASKASPMVERSMRGLHGRQFDRNQESGDTTRDLALGASSQQERALGLKTPVAGVLNSKGDEFYDAAPKAVAVAAAMMQVDFWMMASATAFVGNQLSTLSVNVCRRRHAVGLPCDNFVYAS